MREGADRWIRTQTRRRRNENLSVTSSPCRDHLECLDSLDCFRSVPSNKQWMVPLISAWTRRRLLTIKIIIHHQSETRIHQHHPSFIKWICLCSLEPQQRCKFRGFRQPVNHESISNCIWEINDFSCGTSHWYQNFALSLQHWQAKITHNSIDKT